jgi:hypothetical protein|tara:strand:- start:70 stop:246 length:177 start_codon:yes stop_codon:yes gene_type:complete
MLQQIIAQQTPLREKSGWQKCLSANRTKKNSLWTALTTLHFLNRPDSLDMGDIKRHRR